MSRRPLRQAFVLTGMAVLAALAWPTRPPKPVSRSTSVPSASAQPASLPETRLEPAPPDSAEAPPSCLQDRPLVAPSGAPPHLSCKQARALIAEVHDRFAGTPGSPHARDYARLVSGWLDPHGLWSAAPDAPLGHALRERAQPLLEEVRLAPDSAEPCRTALSLGEDLARWSQELGRIYDDAAAHATRIAKKRAAHLASIPAFQDDPVTLSARSLARRLGATARQFALSFPDFERSVGDGRERYFPSLTAAAWGEVVLAAAVRAYVPLVDPHGDWAPFEEEWSLYADDPGLDGEPRLWREITRTAVGVRIVDGAATPLAVGDLVLSVDGVSTAGMPLEQAEQLARIEPRAGRARRVEVLQNERAEITELEVSFDTSRDPTDLAQELDAESVRFGDSHALVVRIPDVPDGLGQSLGRLLADTNSAELAGLLIDLRGNGGGSTDGAAELIGLFLPGAPLFPLASRGRLMEVMRAAEPALAQRFNGPVATLVDGNTASAAEMIAGALSAYERGAIVGTRTFGKGCIQEYVEDRQSKGVLRVTTLLYALPNGVPVQRVGLTPDILLSKAMAGEKEANLPESLPSYRGPDVRDLARVGARPWPSHHGRLGPCSDGGVCRALWRLGGATVGTRAQAARRVTSRAVAGSAGRP